MAQPGRNPLHDLEAQMRRSDPRFARGRDTGNPRRPRRRGWAWALLALSLATLAVGMVLPHGMLLASGLVTAGVATYLLSAPHAPDRSGLHL
ncbi:DUF3040 domain-containing protein [Actinomadura sp. NPDC047616]|uniref:DUF3040 domain-containing protein n=1 Tax=Actinomadura sp. NPDC047616 TaxID=3155914 RepID=UPI0033FBBCFF